MKHPYSLFQKALASEDATKDFRRIVAPRTVYTDERARTAIATARRHIRDGNLEMAEVWALRALHDGPSVEAFCLLGDVCEDTADLMNAVRWYEQACATDQIRRHEDISFCANRHVRLASIRRQLRECWESRAPIREINIYEEPIHPVFESLEAAVDYAVTEDVISVWHGSDFPADYLKRAVLDGDLAFIAWRHDLQLPKDDHVFDRMWVLPVEKAPFFGETLTLSPWAAARITEADACCDLEIAQALRGEKFGAFSGRECS